MCSKALFHDFPDIGKRFLRFPYDFVEIFKTSSNFDGTVTNFLFSLLLVGSVGNLLRVIALITL
jgi:hypothetical protein